MKGRPPRDTTCISSAGSELYKRKVQGNGNADRMSELYINNGTGNFSIVSRTPFKGVYQSSVAFADIDGDLDHDVLIIGDSNSGILAELYTNDGTGNYSLVTNTPFSGVKAGSLAFADIDGDMDQDVLITGNSNWSNSGIISSLYANDGNGQFSLIPNTTFTGVQTGSIAFADIDGDLDQDVLITGFNNDFEAVSELYFNDGLGNFTLLVNAPFPAVYSSSIAFGDVDSDADQDILSTGNTGNSGSISKLYTNDGFGNYSIAENSSFTS